MVPPHHSLIIHTPNWRLLWRMPFSCLIFFLDSLRNAGKALPRQIAESVSCHHPQQGPCDFGSCFLTILFRMFYFQGLQNIIWSVSHFQGIPLLSGWIMFISPQDKGKVTYGFSHEVSTPILPLDRDLAAIRCLII